MTIIEDEQQAADLKQEEVEEMDDMFDFIENSNTHFAQLTQEELLTRIEKPAYLQSVEYLVSELHNHKSPLDKMRCITHCTVLIS